MRGRKAIVITERQREVWAGIARGLSNKEIVRESGMALGTVKVHAAHVLKRTGSRNRVVAALRFHGVAI